MTERGWRAERRRATSSRAGSPICSARSCASRVSAATTGSSSSAATPCSSPRCSRAWAIRPASGSRSTSWSTRPRPGRSLEQSSAPGRGPPSTPFPTGPTASDPGSANLGLAGADLLPERPRSDLGRLPVPGNHLAARRARRLGTGAGAGGDRRAQRDLPDHVPPPGRRLGRRDPRPVSDRPRGEGSQRRA